MWREPPTLETEQDTDKLYKLLEHQRFDTRLYEAFIDVSRYGNAVLKLVGNILTAVSPQYWFPIVDKSDLKTITQHVIAYPITPGKDGKMTELYVEIHDVGRIEQRTYSFDSDKSEIGALKEYHTEQTGLQDFAIQTLTNITHSGSVYGVDDYAIINSIVAKIMWRLHCMVSPRIKAARLKSINTATIKQVISLLAQINGIPINYNSLQITWNDGLPDDETNRLVTATGGKAIMSQYAALKSMGLSDEQVEAELEQMTEEQANYMPVFLSSVDSQDEDLENE